MHCSICGKRIPKGDTHCPACGAGCDDPEATVGHPAPFDTITDGIQPDVKLRRRRLWLIPVHIIGVLLLICASALWGGKLINLLFAYQAGTADSSLEALRTSAPAISPTAIPTATTEPAAAPAELSIAEESAQKAMGNYTDETVVVFADSQVEAWIRATIIKDKDDITVADMQTIKDFKYDAINNKNTNGTLTTIFDLRYCINLENLFVTNQPITSIECLEDLSKLKTVTLFGCNVSDLSPLAGKEFITSVWINGNPVSDASPVLGLPNLSEFYAVYGTNITDISALRNTHNLRSFFCLNKLNDYTPLFGHENLNKVSLSGMTDDDFAAMLNKLKYLSGIRLEFSSIQDTSLTLLLNHNIRNLTLTNCGIKDISALSSLTTLDSLILTHNKIDDIMPLSGLTQLSDCLDIRYNNIKDFSPLINLKNLKSLWVDPTANDEVFAEMEKNGCIITKSN